MGVPGAAVATDPLTTDAMLPLTDTLAVALVPGSEACGSSTSISLPKASLHVLRGLPASSVTMVQLSAYETVPMLPSCLVTCVTRPNASYWNQVTPYVGSLVVKNGLVTVTAWPSPSNVVLTLTVPPVTTCWLWYVCPNPSRYEV